MSNTFELCLFLLFSLNLFSGQNTERKMICAKTTMRFQRAAMVMSASWPLFLGIGIVLLAAMIISIVIYSILAQIYRALSLLGFKIQFEILQAVC